MSVTVDNSGKTVVIVGGTSGINRGVAEMFAKTGAKVAVASRSEDKVNDTVASLKSLGAEAMGFTVDVRDQEGLSEGFKKVQDAFGEFDVLVSGAAGNFPAFVNGMSANGFRSVIEIDLMGTFHVIQASYPHLKKPGASIINISAPQAFLAMAAQSHVCAAKSGIDMLTRCLALEWGDEGIRINSVVPGPIDRTEGMKRLMPTPELREATRMTVPLKRLGTPEDIANACLFLSSELASYVSGTVFPVDGGWSLSGASTLTRDISDMLKSMKPS